ncbi:MAG: transporter, partial [Microbacterium sp.]|nr:transporter [Microbacterium sp.]
MTSRTTSRLATILGASTAALLLALTGCAGGAASGDDSSRIV